MALVALQMLSVKYFARILQLFSKNKMSIQSFPFFLVTCRQNFHISHFPVQGRNPLDAPQQRTFAATLATTAFPKDCKCSPHLRQDFFLPISWQSLLVTFIFTSVVPLSLKTFWRSAYNPWRIVSAFSATTKNFSFSHSTTAFSFR